MPALKPALYTVPEAGDVSPPSLRGGQCRCGYFFFPMQHYGCERCGATDLAPVQLRGEGTLVASARVMLHARKDRQPPFVVVVVRLDDGPVIRTLLDADTPDLLAVGTRLRATIVTTGQTESGESLVDLRFTRAS